MIKFANIKNSNKMALKTAKILVKDRLSPSKTAKLLFKFHLYDDITLLSERLSLTTAFDGIMSQQKSD